MLRLPVVRFKHRSSLAPNVLLLGYVFGGWAAGLGLLLIPAWPASAAGVLLVAHTLLLSGYLVHECIHDTIFAHRANNFRLGTALAWLNGGCYPGFTELRKKHLHHHADRMDPVSWDFRAFLRGLPAAARGVVFGLEWLHVPAIELLMRVEGMSRPFRRASWRGERVRMVGTLVVRLALFAALAVVSRRAAVLYLVAWMLFVVAMRFFDAFHHTFDLVVLPDYDTRFVPPPAWDRAFEQRNTYSNVLGFRNPILNLLVINFGFHNAHHAKPGVPWFRLPALDRTLHGADQAQVRPAWHLVRNFHRYRVRRLLASSLPEAPDVNIGAVAVSFLTL